MGYRRPHHRRAHTRTNSDGSKSYVSKSFVRGHNYNEEKDVSSSDSNDAYRGRSVLANILFLVGIACLILFLLGMVLGWDVGDVLFYGVIFLVCLIIFFKLKNGP